MDEVWRRLEADLALRAAGISAAETDARRAELLRAERAAVTLADRLRAAGGPVAVTVAGTRITGEVLDVGADHVRLRVDATECWVAAEAGVTWEGLGRAHAPASRVASAWTLAAALRRLAADRADVAVVRRDGRTLVGRVESVGRDHADLRVDAATAGREGAVLTVPIAAIAVLRRG